MKRFLFATLAAGLVAAALPAQDTRLLRFPAVHGDTVVFTYASDLWAADRKGGAARRLTAHRGEERRACISPDGSWIAFLASYDGDTDLYVMPVEGGMPRRLTFDSISENLAGWTPDGKIAYASTAGSFTSRQSRLWLIAPEGGLPTATPLAEFATGSFFPGGQRVAYNRTNSYNQNWRRYRGGNAGRISLYDLATNTYSELPGQQRENSWHPLVIGESVYYVSDRNAGNAGGMADNGAVNLYRHDLATGKDTQLTHHADADVRWPSTDGKTIVYELDGYIHAYDVATGRDERLAFQVKGDDLAARPYLLKVGKQLSSLALAPGGARILAEARGDVFDLAVKGKDVRNVTATPGVRERSPRWSPDGKTIAYLSDASGEYQLYSRPASGPGVGREPRQLSAHTGPGIRGFSWSPDGRRLAFWTEEAKLFLLDPETRQTRPVFKADYQPESVTFDWSPDGRWIAFTAPRRNGFGAISLYEVETGKTTPVTDGFYDDRNVRFDLSGKYLYFTSARTFNPSGGRFEASLKVEDADRVYLIPLAKDLPNPLFPKEVKVGAESKDPKDSKDGKGKDDQDRLPRVRIDLDGLAGRAVLLPFPAGEPGELYAGKEAVYHYDFEKLRKLDLASQEVVTIYEGPEVELDLDPERTRLAYFANGTLGVTEIKPGVKNGDGKVDVDAVEVWVDPQAEWRQILWEVWRFERDNFFREDMAGLDWPAVGKRYETYLPHVRHWSDFRHVLGLLLGELGTSHAYVEAPPEEPAHEDRKAKAAMLGADYERDGKWVRFQRIYPGTLTQDSLRGPLGEPGLNLEPGDYLLAIDGQPLEDTHPGALLINKADRVVTLTVNDRPSRDGAREIRVRPVASEDNLRYYEWVEENRRKVAAMSGGRIGYIHYPNTATGGQTEFIRGYFAQTDKDAVILDERFNSGGFPQPMVLPTLGRRRQTVVRYRKWQAGSEIVAIDGPKAMLINGYAGSGGDLTPWMFRDAGMGVLIGTRTFGGLVGIEEYRRLIGGGNVSAPAYTRFDPKTGEWIAENRGIEPDIEVDARPDLVAQGRDPQLEKAVEYLMDQLAKNPRTVAEPKLPAPARRAPASQP